MQKIHFINNKEAFELRDKFKVNWSFGFDLYYYIDFFKYKGFFGFQQNHSDKFTMSKQYKENFPAYNLYLNKEHKND